MYDSGDNGHHTMRHIELRNDYHEFVCDICGRHVLIHSNPSRAEAGDQTFVILKQGDFGVAHSGGIGLLVNAVEVQEEHISDQDADQVELSDEWKAWLADIFDDIE